MPKRYHNLSLAKSPQEWNGLDETINRSVAGIFRGHNDPEQVSSFLLLVDLMTNTDYPYGDREPIIFEVQRQAFQYTPEFQAALDAYMQKLIPYQEKAAKTA